MRYPRYPTVVCLELCTLNYSVTGAQVPPQMIEEHFKV